MRGDKIIKMSLWDSSRSEVFYTREQALDSELRAAVTHAPRKQREAAGEAGESVYVTAMYSVPVVP